MHAAVNWSNVNIAGAFVVGAVAGTVATIRIMRALLTYLRSERDEARRDPDDPPT